MPCVEYGPGSDVPSDAWPSKGGTVLAVAVDKAALAAPLLLLAVFAVLVAAMVEDVKDKCCHWA
jgi:hypothetical protein